MLEIEWCKISVLVSFKKAQNFVINQRFHVDCPQEVKVIKFRKSHFMIDGER